MTRSPVHSHALWNPKVHVLILILVTIFSYLNIFQNTFVWDDHDLIENWKEIQSWSNIPSLFTRATNPNYPDTYRPIRYVFSIVMFQISGTNPFGYHLATLLLHVMVTVLTYCLLRNLTKDTRIPFLAALLFGIHPIHTEAVTWISSGMDMIGFVFMLGSLTLASRPSNKSMVWLSVVLSAFAYFTLEITIMLPALLIIIAIYFRQIKSRHVSFASIFPHVLLAGLYLYIRWRVISIQEVFGYVDNRIDLTVIVMLRALVSYVRTICIPFPLTINHALGTGIPSFMVEIGDAFPTTLEAIRSVSITDPISLLGIGLIIIGGVSMALFRSKAPLVTFAIGWIGIAFLPVMNIIPGHILMAERYAYIPSIGFCLLFALLTTTLLDASRSAIARRVVILLFVLVCIVYISLTIIRNFEWKNDFTLWKSAAARNPYSYIAYAALGKQYLLHEDYEHAISTYEHILHVYPEQKKVVGYLTELYIHQKRYADALKLVHSVILLRPQEADIWVKLGDIYRLVPNIENATYAYHKALEIDPENKLARMRLDQLTILEK